MEILYSHPDYFAVHKPAGYFVHPPEISPYPVPRSKICIYVLKEHFGFPVFPVHRLDAPTSGVLLFANSRHATRELSALFRNQQIQKTYLAIARGWTESEGIINHPLEFDDGSTLEAETHYKTLKQIELPYSVGKKYTTTRYSLVQVTPQTGRWHQIRRHFDRIAHPLIGDIDHGDTYHNRFFRDTLQLPGLFLLARELSFVCPFEKRQIHIQAPLDERWLKALEFFNTSPEQLELP